MRIGLTGLLFIVGGLAATFLISFGTLSPCEALRTEARAAGRLNGDAAETFVAAKAATWNPAQCFVWTLRLRASGKDALNDLVAE